MKRFRKSFIGMRTVGRSCLELPAVLGVAILLQGSIAVAGLAEGYRAYVRGEYQTAYTELLPVARAGDYNAGYYLGLLYWEGNGVEKDLATAVVWLSDAAARGHAGAQLSMALAYENGQGVERNYHRGAELMSEAA